MNYMGSKRKIASKILPIILKNRQTGQFYVEPFVGGGNIFDKVENPRIGGDVDIYTIAALRLIRDNPTSLPSCPKMTPDEVYENYMSFKEYSTKYPFGLAGYYAYALSYGGKFFGGWRRDSIGKRNYINEAYRNAQVQSPRLHGSILIHGPYDYLYTPKNAIIYCDPPYCNTTAYNSNDNKFDCDRFWKWCIKKKNQGHNIFISEYAAPEDFTCVWEEQVNNSLNNTKAIEKLFTLT